MATQTNTDNNPLAVLIGHWRGDKGMDVAPEPDGPDNNPYYENITFTHVGDVDNAGVQVLDIIHYQLVVQRKSNDEVFHHQTGYWLWDAEKQSVMHSFTIPRGLALVAGGHVKVNNDELLIEVNAGADYPQWPIAQSEFMQNNARTISFSQQLTVKGDTLHYQQMTLVDIYGKPFEHTDENSLQRI